MGIYLSINAPFLMFCYNKNMKQDIEYQIIVGCNDSFSRDEFVKYDELKKIIVDFFQRKEVDFSLLKQDGGFLYNDGEFVMENGVCVTIIGADDERIMSLAKSLKMFMNQERILVIKNKLETKII